MTGKLYSNFTCPKLNSRYQPSKLLFQNPSLSKWNLYSLHTAIMQDILTFLPTSHKSARVLDSISYFIFSVSIMSLANLRPSVFNC